MGSDHNAVAWSVDIMGLNSEIPSGRECGKPLPESAGRGTRFCADCNKRHRLESWRKSKRKSYKKHRKAILRDRKAEYQWYKERGICVDCHAADAVIRDGVRLTRCAACAERQRSTKKKT